MQKTCSGLTQLMDMRLLGRVWSMTTPRFDATRTGITWLDHKVRLLTSMRCWYQGVQITSSVLLSFRQSSVAAIRIRICTTQDSRARITTHCDVAALILKKTYSWVLSAKSCIFRLKYLAMMPIGIVSMVKSMGPSTRPCVTPYFRSADSKIVPSMTTRWVRPSR